MASQPPIMRQAALDRARAMSRSLKAQPHGSRNLPENAARDEDEERKRLKSRPLAADLASREIASGKVFETLKA